MLSVPWQLLRGPMPWLLANCKISVCKTSLIVQVLTKALADKLASL